MESLEARENPTTLLYESFEQVTPPAVPDGWQSWSAGGEDYYLTSRITASTGQVSLASTGTLASLSRSWVTAPMPGDAGVSARVRSDGPAPVEVFARGQDLGDVRASYVAAVVGPGARYVQLKEVKNGTVRIATTLNRDPVYGPWLTVTLQPDGRDAAVRVQRMDTGQYLNVFGMWQTEPADAMSGRVSWDPPTGLTGVGRNPGGQGMVFLDDFTVTSPPFQEVHESFDGQPAGALPPNWAGWTGDGSTGFAVSDARMASAPYGLAADGTSATEARAWLAKTAPADVQASASFFVDSLIPGTLFVRGSNLDSAGPTYYGLTVTRGMTVRLGKNVNGTYASLASVTTDSYFSAKWVRLTLTARGGSLQAVVFRADTGQWLSPDGTWSDFPQPALEATDGAITGEGNVGFNRSRSAAGPIGFDDLDVVPADLAVGPRVTITTSQPGTTFKEDVTFRAVAAPAGSARRVEFRLDGEPRAAFPVAPAEWALDTTLLANGAHELVVRAIDQAGNVGSTTFAFTTANENPTPPPDRPALPRKLSHIRIAQLAYTGNPMGPFEKMYLANAVDLVIPNTSFLQTIDTVSPATQQLVYSNLSNLYQGLLTNWLNYADRVGANRELAFYHVGKATAFTGGSPSSQPVSYLWGVYRGPATSYTGLTDLTSAARGGRTFGVAFGGTGDAISIGYPDRFRELNYTLNRGAAAGWRGVYEYVAAVDADGFPTAWKPLALTADGTNSLTQSGQVTFDPPKDWVAATVGGTSARLFYVRVRAEAGTATTAPDVKLIFGRDYVGAAGRTQGTIPAFDYAADADGDGYLSDAEYAGRASGKDARFVYESRLFYPYYGQMRFVTNPSSSAVRHWAAAYHVNLLGQYPLADGLFLDNSNGRVPFAGTPVIEPTAAYGRETANMVAAVWAAVAPKVVFSNTSGGLADADPVAKASTGVFEEFVLRPTETTWSGVTDIANLVRRRLGADSPSPYVVLDTHPGFYHPTNERVRSGALAYYYLLADPDRTMLMFFGGYSPSAPWSQSWIPAATHDVGLPVGEMTTWASGQDPENAALEYRVFGREYSKALMLYKPRSYTLGRGTGTLNDATATTHQLGGNYRVLHGDGTTGPIVTQVTLRNGEGVVLLKA
ncbi:MAG TPA: Ig-like domain-containing protein [Fimbriiglobus sp.]|nr:Ig-like domain-containing protein [Fimbriiglobus sp.]